MVITGCPEGNMIFFRLIKLENVADPRPGMRLTNSLKKEKVRRFYGLLYFYTGAKMSKKRETFDHRKI